MSPHLYISLVLFSFFFFNHISSASDSITVKDSLSGDTKLISNGGKFELGFFRPGKSPYYYIGIWYSLDRVSQLTPVWVANRATPISDHTQIELKISTNGNLVLSNHSNPLIWSTNITTTSKSTIAVLLDSGNLVLRDGSNPNLTLWQSIDHPTHTWLPGGKLGLNKVTGELQRLISWKTQDDPSPGIFSLEIDPKGSSPRI
ncbi:G-type lectin S-receptor-like serine/threonine-protein kinase At2g19130 [Asparagus officinalis]|uniref:G-type lectin S-receptor-like serine/threonine-protein kinase At2g19130 n=1 Tax=Asparagus officinalis TaxID=4686 RepID=UPI00098E7526|nr:G-type lectin S-receptor-like serine/threonine-protein kinase At2g19130 [Asparagus officinalis]